MKILTINLPSTFLTAKNFINISQLVSMLAVVAFTMTVVMVMNDFENQWQVSSHSQFGLEYWQLYL